MGMHRKTGRWLLIVALTTAPSAGCKSGFTFWNPFAKPTMTPGSPMLQGDGDGGYIQAPMPQQAPPEPRAEEFGWKAPFKKFGDTISSPFKKSAASKPAKPILAEDDPISLTSKQAPPGAKLYVSLAEMHKKAGNLEAAVENYDRAIEAEPKSLPALLGMAHLYDGNGNTAKALEYYNRAVKAHDDSAAAHNDLGLCLLRDNQPKESIEELKKAIDLEPTKPLYRNNLAKILVELDRADEAYKILAPVHGEATAHYNIGYMLNTRGLKAQALEHFRIAAKLDPNLKRAQQWVAILSPGETQTHIAATAPAMKSAPKPTAQAATRPAAVAAPASYPTSPPVATTQPATAPARYPQAQVPEIVPAISGTTGGLPVGGNSGNSVDINVTKSSLGDKPIPAGGAASVLAAARAVTNEPLGAGPDNAARGGVIQMKTVSTPIAGVAPSLDTPIPSPIVVPGRAAPQSSVDARAARAGEIPGAASAGPVVLPPTTPMPTATPLPAAEEEVQGPRLSDRQRTGGANLVGDRYATGSPYATGNSKTPILPPRSAVPPLPGPYSKTGGTQPPVAVSDAATDQAQTPRPATANRYPPSRY